MSRHHPHPIGAIFVGALFSAACAGAQPTPDATSATDAAAISANAEESLQALDGEQPAAADTPDSSAPTMASPEEAIAQGAPIEEAPAPEPPAQDVPAEVAPEAAPVAPACKLRPAPGRQPSLTARTLLCQQARHDLNCPDGEVTISVLGVGNPWNPWSFSVEGCGYGLTYLMRGNAIFRN